MLPLLADDRQFQLISFSADRRLRMWPIDEDTLAFAGHVPGAPITSLARPSATLAGRSYHHPHDAPPAPITFEVSPPPIRKALMPGPSALSASLASTTNSTTMSSLLTAQFASQGNPAQSRSASPASAKDAPRPNTVLMTTNPIGSNRRRKADLDQAWREGVKDEGVPIAPTGQRPAESGLASAEASTMGEQTTLTRSSSLLRGTDSGTIREGAATERAESAGQTRAESVATGTMHGREPSTTYVDLGAEITKVVGRLKGYITFERTNIQQRTCTVSLKHVYFLRATFTFPKGYPASAAPTINLERNVDVPLPVRARLVQSVRRVMSQHKDKGLPSFEAALTFLLGQGSSLDEDTNQDDDEDDAVGGLLLDGDDAELGDRHKHYNLVLPRRVGAVFGPTGKLFSFSNVVAATTPPEDRNSTRTRSPTDASTRQRGVTRGPDVFGQAAASVEPDYVETDEALQVSTGLSFMEVSDGISRPSRSTADHDHPAADLPREREALHARARCPRRPHLQLRRARP